MFWSNERSRTYTEAAAGFDSETSSEGSSEEVPEILVEITASATRSLEAPSWIKSAQERLGFRGTELLLRIATLVWLTTGVIVLTTCGEEEEKLTFLTAVYVIVQLVTTVGYGDIHPLSEGMRLFMAIYCVIGNVLAALVITERVQRMINRTEGMLSQNKVQECIEETKRRGSAPSSQQAQEVSHGMSQRQITETMRPLGESLKAALIYALFILIGATYYGLIDNCICQTDAMVKECFIDSRCEEMGGHRRTFTKGFYMACITMTTVGFGDQLPTTWSGRLFGIFWMLFGVGAMANFAASLAHTILMHNMKSMVDHGISEELFQKIDQDGSGALTKFEFITYMLVKCGLVNEKDLDMLLAEFERRDKDKSGELSYEEIAESRKSTHSNMESDKSRHSPRSTSRVSTEASRVSTEASRETSRAAEGTKASQPVGYERDPH